MDLRPILKEINKHSFVVSGLSKEELITVSDVLKILIEHFSDIEKEEIDTSEFLRSLAKPKRVLRDGDVIEDEETQSFLKSHPHVAPASKSNDSESEKPEELPAEIQFALDQTMESPIVEEHPSNGNNQAQGNSPAGPVSR